MRKIKFRAWDGERMRESFVIHQCNGTAMVQPHLNAPLEFRPDWIAMQFAGLYDANGVEIYEGDIVKAASQGQHAVCEIKWGQGRCGFFLHSERGGIVWNLSGGGKDYREESVEIIGNIYENPELLKEI